MIRKKAGTAESSIFTADMYSGLETTDPRQSLETRDILNDCRKITKYFFFIQKKLDFYIKYL